MFDIDIKLIKSKQVKCRKEHRCWLCDQTIRKGNICLSETRVIDGYIETDYRCKKCYKKKTTVWKRFNDKEGKFIHNHIEDGHKKHNRPRAKSEKQIKSWKGAIWQKQFKYLQDGKVV